MTTLCRVPLAQTPIVSEPAGGIDAHWRLDASGAWAPGTTIAVIGLAAALVVYCYTREASPAGRAYRTLLGGLRLATVALLLLMLSELLLAGTRSGRPRFVVLVDRSASMELIDPGVEQALPSPLKSALADADAAGDPTRRQISEAVLLSDELGLLNRLADEFDVSVMAVADGVARLADGALGQQQPGGGGPPNRPTGSGQPGDEPHDNEQPAGRRLGPPGGATRLGDAVDQLLGGGETPPQGVLLLTDGQNTAGRDLAAAAEAARRGAAPLYLIGVGKDEPPPDLAVTDLLADDAAYVDDLVRLRATLRWRGAGGAPVRVSLREAGASQTLVEQVIETKGPGGAAPIQLVFQPGRAGPLRLTIVAEPLADERDVGNNRVSHTLTVHDGKLKVLLLAAAPNYEFRYLKHLLERDQSVELATVLQEAGPGYAEADPTAIPRFPIRRGELDKHDVVVLMDADPRLLPRSVWPALRAFVAESGGGLALVAGPRNLPWAYRRVDDFAALSPLEIAAAPPGGTPAGEGFLPLPTEQGLRSPAMQLDDTASASARVWRTLPKLYWWAGLGPAKPAAQVLAAHPTARGGDGRPAPLIATQYFGAGRVLMHAFDATYRWRYRVGDVYFARYWVQSLRALARGKLRGGSATELTTDRPRYSPGDPIRFRLERPPLAVGEDAPSELLLQPENGPERRVAMAPERTAPGVYAATLDDLPIGRYRVLLPGSGGGATGRGPAAAAFEVAAPPSEMTNIERAGDAMQAAADRSRGWYLPVERADEAADRLPRGVRVPLETLPPVELWNRWWMLAAIVGCLSTEWILRKRRAML